MNRFTALIATSVMALSSYAAAKNLATINGKGLSEKEFKESVKALGPRAESMLENPMMRKQILDHIIDSKLLSGAADKAGLTKSGVYKARMEEAKRQILANMYTEKYIEDNTKDAKLKAHFDKNKKTFSNKEVKAAHILMKDEKEAAKVLAEAKKKGADFAALAKKHSTGPSGPKGGDLGFFGPGRMVPEFEKAAFATKKGVVHPNLVKTRFGFHIIKVTDVKGGDSVKFADVKDKVKRQLEQELRTNLVKDLRSKAKVSVDEGALKEMKM